MAITADEIDWLGERHGFRANALEKSVRLLELLRAIYRHPDLRSHCALRGGTALRMFYLNRDRFSVAINLIYAGKHEPPGQRDIDKALREVLDTGWLGLKPETSRHPDPATLHWRIGCKSVAREAEYPLDFIAVDVTVHSHPLLYEPKEQNSHSLGQRQALDIRVADPYEIAAGKLSALIGRREVRDLYDVGVLHRSGWDKERIRQTFLAVNEPKGHDVHIMNPQGLAVDPDSLRNDLLPVLQRRACGHSRADLENFAQIMRRDAGHWLNQVLSESANNNLGRESEART